MYSSLLITHLYLKLLSISAENFEYLFYFTFWPVPLHLISKSMYATSKSFIFSINNFFKIILFDWKRSPMLTVPKVKKNVIECGWNTSLRPSQRAFRILVSIISVFNKSLSTMLIIYFRFDTITITHILIFPLFLQIFSFNNFNCSFKWHSEDQVVLYNTTRFDFMCCFKWISNSYLRKCKWIGILLSLFFLAQITPKQNVKWNFNYLTQTIIFLHPS